ncbi:RDD family protein, partial [Kitasatospora sp. NPDC059571]|uniref:RDD family protein n=1 Tax=Kitasatospora sp. NPDC059571 TaxID=3346871 RepID=UPI0036B8DC57
GTAHHPHQGGSPRSHTAPRPAGRPQERPAEPRPARPGTSTTGAKAAGRRTEPEPLQTAGLGRRLAARLVDTLVVAVVAVAAGVPLTASAVAHVQEKLDQARAESLLAGRQVQVLVVDGVVLGKAGVLLGVLLVLGLLYEVLPTARTGQTFGKRIARIRVVDTRGARSRRPAAGQARRPARSAPPIGRSLVRWIVRQLGVLLPIGLFWPLLDRRARRGWHDRAARTRVVKA